MQKSKQYNGTRLLVYYVLIMVLLTLLVVSTYTWFTINRELKVNDLSLYVNSQNGLEISQKPDGDWGPQLEFSNLVNEMAPLRPVSWSEEDQRFYAAYYGLDGRLLDYWQPLTDDVHTNRDDAHGYYSKGVFYMRTDVDMKVSLSSPVAAPGGASGTFVVGRPIWDSVNIRHYNGGFGAEGAIRLGMKITPIQADGTAKEDETRFIIIEPNADTHTDGSTGYLATPNINGEESLVPSDRLIIQNTATWVESDPVLRDNVIWTMGDFTTDTYLFELKKNEMVRIEVYIWLEGQDADCNNRIGQQAEILANLQFEGTPDSSSGLVPIA